MARKNKSQTRISPDRKKDAKMLAVEADKTLVNIIDEAVLLYKKKIKKINDDDILKF